MIKGILFTIAACSIWGLIFVVPSFMREFNAVEVAVGRFFFYGLISIPFLKPATLSWALCKRALGYSLIAAIAYYTFLVCALRFATPAVTALIIGFSPIVIAFYGNWKQKECSFKSLIFPCILMAIGLLIINIPLLRKSDTPSYYLFGIANAFLSLGTWCWYAVANARFLKKHPHVTPSQWSTLIGTACLFWITLGVLLFGSLFGFDYFVKYTILTPALQSYLLGCMILGCFCSWVGAFLWNRASFLLPISLAGQLLIFETIFGVVYVYSFAHHTPPLYECLGIAILLAATIYGIRAASRLSDPTA